MPSRKLLQEANREVNRSKFNCLTVTAKSAIGTGMGSRIVFLVNVINTRKMKTSQANQVEKMGGERGQTGQQSKGASVGRTTIL